MIKTNDKVQSSGWCLVNKLDGTLARLGNSGVFITTSRSALKRFRDNNLNIEPSEWRIAKAQVCATVTK